MGPFTMSILAFAILAVPARADLSPPTADGKPVVVSIGFYALDFARITSRDESFDVTGYLEMSWRDPRVVPPESGGKRVRKRLDPAAAWTPRVFFENAIEQPKYHHDAVVEVDPEGVVSSWVLVSGKFSALMDLRRFPFDTQVMSVRIAAFEDESVVTFVVKPELVLVGQNAFVTDWTIEEPAARVKPRRFVHGQETYSGYEYDVGVRRRSTFYVWRVMMPLSLLAIVSYVAFWFEPVGLQPQISTCMSALIALVAFNFSIDFSLPKVAYLTLIDRHALIGFGFLGASIIAVTCIHLAVTNGRLPVARSIQRFARWTFLPAYLACAGTNLFLLSR